MSESSLLSVSLESGEQRAIRTASPPVPAVAKRLELEKAELDAEIRSYCGLKSTSSSMPVLHDVNISDQEGTIVDVATLPPRPGKAKKRLTWHRLSCPEMIPDDYVDPRRFTVGVRKPDFLVKSIEKKVHGLQSFPLNGEVMAVPEERVESPDVRYRGHRLQMRISIIPVFHLACWRNQLPNKAR